MQLTATLLATEHAVGRYGTGAFALINTGASPAKSTSGLLTTALYQLGPDAEARYALEGSVGSCATGQEWFCAQLEMFGDAKELHALAETVPAGAEGVVFVSAFGGLLAPRWRDDARGTLAGLTLAHSRKHVARAVVEGIGHQVREVVEAMVLDSGVPLHTMRVDGGVANSNTLLQFQADILNVPVGRPRDVETTALGAALCAGVGAGVWTPEHIADEISAETRTGESVVERIFEPQMETEIREQLCKRWDLAVSSSLGWATDA
jgi:glycerol kinase